MSRLTVAKTYVAKNNVKITSSLRLNQLFICLHTLSQGENIITGNNFARPQT